jgi:hypothetical protein
MAGGLGSARGSGGWACTACCHCRAVRVGELFARPAAVTVHNAQVLTQSLRLAAQLAEALTSRAVIDQAIGVLMSRSGAGADEAFGRLRSMSQSRHTKVADVAQGLVDEAVRRARSRQVAVPDLVID